MNAFDSSILVAALVVSGHHHSAWRNLLTSGPFGVWAHGFVETFNTLTSGKIKPRPSAANVARALRHSISTRATTAPSASIHSIAATSKVSGGMAIRPLSTHSWNSTRTSWSGGSYPGTCGRYRGIVNACRQDADLYCM